MSTTPFSIISNCDIHPSVRIVGWANLYGCIIKKDSFIGPFVEIGHGAVIGERTRISSHSYICNGTIVGDDCFVAHGIVVLNDDFKVPDTYRDISELSAAWHPKPVTIGNSVRIGSGAILLPGVNIGDHAVIGAGAVVCQDVAEGAVVKGIPARESLQKAIP